MRLDYAVGKGHFAVGVDATGSELMTVAVRAADGRQQKASVGNADCLGSVDVVLQFVVAASCSVDFHVPGIGGRGCRRRIVVPRQHVAFGADEPEGGRRPVWIARPERLVNVISCIFMII